MKPDLDQLDQPLLRAEPESMIGILSALRYIVLIVGLMGIVILSAGDTKISGPTWILSIISLAFLVFSIIMVEKLFIFLYQIREASYQIAFGRYDDIDSEGVNEEEEEE